VTYPETITLRSRIIPSPQNVVSQLVWPSSKKIWRPCSRAGVPNLGYICLSEGVHLMIPIEEQKIFAYNTFLNIYTYISEYSFWKLFHACC